MSAAESTSAISDENWKLLYFFNLYRAILGTLASAVALSPLKVSPFGEKEPILFAVFSILYLVIALIGMGMARARITDFESQATFFAFADIAILTLMLHASGGLSSGMGLLLVIAVAAASLMLDKRFTVFFAALATIAIGLEHNWEALRGGPWITDGYPQLAMLGLGLFGTAGIGFGLANRLRKTEALAIRRGVDLANLAQVNGLIIQHMQSGVIVCDQVGHVRMINKAAKTFLAINQTLAPHALLTDLSADLASQLFKWMEHRDNRIRQLLRTRSGYTLLPRFVALGTERDTGILIFLEDTSILRQQAQQLKMAALARLTASIAHEVRNPLGAITNAAQLLSENSTTGPEDQRLVRIIEDQSRRLNAIVENVMQLSRRDHLNPLKFDLQRWLAEFAPQFCELSKIPAQAIVVLGEAGISIYVDPDQLYQVVANLCQNAIRHSPPFTEKPLIELEAGIDEETRPTLDVIDWGSGIKPEIVDNIFDPFFTTTPKGTGLGLYIARELCEGNGARLDYHPGEGVGSRFRVTFAKADD